MMPRADPFRLFVPALLIAALLAIYVPDVGRGFVRDDFAWIHQNRITTSSDLVRVFRQDNGFYRPLVGLSFGLSYAMFGLRAFPFALTNLALLLLAATILGAVARRAGLSRGAALFAGALWAGNPHGVPMAVLWISGRTSLLLCLFALLAAAALLYGRRFLAGACCLAALLSKEEAVLLPLILAGWAGFGDESPRFRVKRALAATWPCFLALAPYIALRSMTRAYLPHTAPGFYRPALDVAGLARNVLEYGDRSCSLPLAALLLLAMWVRRRPRVEDREWQTAYRGLIWLVLGFGLTVFLPVRSSLYALFPAVGSSLAAAALAQALWRDAGPAARRWIPWIAVVVPFVAIPAYRARAVRWVRPAALSTRALADLVAQPAEPGTITILHDTERRLAGAFGTLLPEALDLVAYEGPAWIDPPAPGAHPLQFPEPVTRVRHLFLREGRLVGLGRRAP